MDPAEENARKWLKRLLTRMNARQSRLAKFEDYHDGKHPLSYATQQFRVEFAGLLGALHDNWCPLVCSAVEERLDVQGFRFARPAPGDDQAEAEQASRLQAEALRLWQARAMDAQSQMTHYEALKLSESHMLVWSERDGEIPMLTLEHPSQMIVDLDPSDRRVRRAALKSWRDEDLGQLATVYLPEALWKFRRGAKGWEPRKVDGEPWPLPNPVGVVPVVPFVNAPRLLGCAELAGKSEFENAIPKQDMINKLLADMIVAAEFSAFRQRWATGVEIPKKSDGTPSEEYVAAVDRLWTTKAKDAKFGEFAQTDLNVYVKAIEMLVQHIASQTATPPHYLLTSGQMPSGESLRAAEAPLTAKARRKQRVFGDSWEQVIDLSFAFMKVEGWDANEWTIETIWGDPETRTESEHVDAVSKLSAIGVPTEMLWERTGFSPTEIARMRSMMAQSAALNSLGQAAPGTGDAEDPAEIAKRAEALGQLIRADAASAAELIGLGGLTFTGAMPVSLRLPETAAAKLEQV